jgi:hypothetical protein
MTTTPSAEALAIAKVAINTLIHAEIEGNSVSLKLKDKELTALIDTALAKARLEGAKAMQEAAAKEGDYVYECEFSALKTVGERILALDPQQVINESMGK